MADYDMDDFDLQDVEDTLEYKFARDLIRHVLDNRMTGLNWVPEGIFERTDLAEHPESPFTPLIRAAVEAKLNLYERRYHVQFDNHFPGDAIERAHYIATCKNLRTEFLTTEFNIREFFKFSVVLAKYAGLAYLYAIVDGPQETFKIIVATVRHLMEREVISDSFWTEMQDWAREPDLAEPEDQVPAESSDESDGSERTETSSESGRQPV